MKKPVYLDYAATTPVDKRVAEKMMACLTIEDNFGNAASRSHIYGWQAEEAIENARSQLANLINADTREIVWTSGATEANNLAIKGCAEAVTIDSKKVKNHIVTSLIEHKAVLDTCRYLESKGFAVTYLKPGSDGLISAEQVREAVTEKTFLVTLMHVNNEIGVVNNLKSIGEVCRQLEVLFHVDAAQSPGKQLIDVRSMNIDLMSLSAHKMYGPKGIGALFVKRKPKVKVVTQIHGGGHERGMRSGTLATHQIVGMGYAAELCQQECVDEIKRIKKLRDQFLDGLKTLDGIKLNGCLNNRVVQNLNLSFAEVDGESLLISLRDLAVSTGSACVSTSVEPSYVLQAIGVPRELAHASIRFSFGRYTKKEDIDLALNNVISAITHLRK